MKETKEARKERQRIEEWQFIEVLRAAGNVIAAEVQLPNVENPRYPYRIDYMLNHEVALEIEGYGRHQSWKGWHSDVRKYNLVAASGFLLIRVTRAMVANGDALEALAQAGVRVTPAPSGTYKGEG